jgi:hypothetical protein
MKSNKISIIKKSLASLLLVAAFSPLLYAQTEATTDKPVNKAVRKTFENQLLINNQTVESVNKKTLDFVIQHRFGLMKNWDDLMGLYAHSNIRLGLTYGVTDRGSVGIGATKAKRQYDLQWKYVLLKQTKPGGCPVTVTYYGNVIRKAGDESLFINQDSSYKGTNRLSYFHEIMVHHRL